MKFYFLICISLIFNCFASTLIADCNETITTFPYYESFESYPDRDTLSSSGWYTINETVNSDARWTVYGGYWYASSTFVHGERRAVFDAFSSGETISEVNSWFYSPCFNLVSEIDAQFFFQFQFVDQLSIFRLEVTTDGGQSWNVAWNGGGLLLYADLWHAIQVNLNAYVGESVQLRFYTKYTPPHSRSDAMFLDDIRMETSKPIASSCNTTVDTFPYQNGFESGLGYFINHSSNQSDWTRISSSSASYEGSYYLRSPFNTFYHPVVLESPCFDLRNATAASFEFRFNSGSQEIQELKLLIHSTDEPAWTSIFEQNGAQNSTWQLASIDLEAYLGQKIQFRLYYSGITSYMKLDALNLSATIDPNPPPPDSTNVDSTALDSTLVWRLVDDIAYVMDEKVAIGTEEAGDYHLAVNGKVKAQEVNITISGWPDYVFRPQYPLSTLDKLEEYIQRNGHLPNIPPEHEVLTEGISVGYINAKLLEKIEELTLHILEQQELINQLRKLFSHLDLRERN